MNTNNLTRYKRGFRDLYQLAQDFNGLNKSYIIDKNVEGRTLTPMLNDPKSGNFF